MAGLARDPDHLEQPWSPLAFGLDAVLGSYSLILFSRSRWVGGLLLAATLVAPVAGLTGLLAVLLALLFAKLLNFNPEQIRAGFFGYNAMLVGLGFGGMFQPGPASLALLVAAVLLTVLATASFNAALGAMFNLPSLTLPFLFVFFLVILVAPRLTGMQSLPFEYSPFLQGEWLPHMVASYLKALGALFFQPRVDVGAVFFLALLVFSRIGVLLSLMGFAIAYPVSLMLVSVPDAPLHMMMGYNLMLTAIALGGIWFVPQLSSFVFAAAGCLVAALLTVGSGELLGRVGLPLLIVPFNLAVIPLLHAMRLRSSDGRPKAVDFLMGTPEENLNYFTTRMARFGHFHHIRFQLPVMGRWVCTQGENGDQTHKAQWRHAFDFEVQDAQGRLFKGSGRQKEDHLCYRLPVLASADGTVVKTVDDVPDNEVGHINARENWGNLVLLYHAPGLYSLVCHLQPNSVKVHEGQPVRKGDILGLCGNSGRSPRPHLHFQLQGTARIGAPTLKGAFHEVVQVLPEGEHLLASIIPKQGELVRNLEPATEVSRMFDFPVGRDLELSDGHSKELVVSQIDLFGNLLLTSPERRGVLFFENRPPAFTIYDYIGPRRSGLYLLYAALPRVPFDPARDLQWTDHLAGRHSQTWPRRLLADLMSPFVGVAEIQMSYRAEHRGEVLTVLGESKARWRGQPLMRTEAELNSRLGPVRLQLTVRNKTRTVTLRPAPKGLAGSQDAEETQGG